MGPIMSTLAAEESCFENGGGYADCLAFDPHTE